MNKNTQKIQRKQIGLTIPVLLLFWLSDSIGHTRSAVSNTLLTAQGIVDAVDDTSEVISFQLVKQDLRFAIDVDSPADRAAVVAALHAADQTYRSVVVHFDLAGARFSPDRTRVIYPVRNLEYDGKTFSAGDKGTRSPQPEQA